MVGNEDGGHFSSLWVHPDTDYGLRLSRHAHSVAYPPALKHAHIVAISRLQARAASQQMRAS
jgi:hypothetical protein